MDEVIDAQLLQLQHDGAEIRTQDLGIRVLLHLVLVGLLGVQAETFPGLGSTGSAGSLLGRGLRDRGDEKGLHSDSRVVDFLLRKAWKIFSLIVDTLI